MRKKVIPDEVRKIVIKRLEQHVREKYAKYDIGLILDFKGAYLYVDYEEGYEESHLCRIRYTGEIDSWDMEIYKYSDNCYDQEGEYPGSGGTVEECFDEAAALYITETFDKTD